jgi:hypothetical protein
LNSIFLATLSTYFWLFCGPIILSAVQFLFWVELKACKCSCCSCITYIHDTGIQPTSLQFFMIVKTVTYNTITPSWSWASGLSHGLMLYQRDWCPRHFLKDC